MPVTPLQGPLVRNFTLAPVDGYLPPAKGLNAYMLAQNSYAVGGIPVSGTATNPVVMTQPAITQLVINTGTAIKALKVNATTVTLPTIGSPQDVYVDVDNTGAYSTHGGAAGFNPPAPAVTALRLYRVRTGASGIGVASINPLAAVGPFNPPLSSVMNTAGSNAGAVHLPSTLRAHGVGTFHGLTMNNGILNWGVGPAVTSVNGAVSTDGLHGPPPTLTVNPFTSNTALGKVSFSIAATAGVVGIAIFLNVPATYVTQNGMLCGMDANTAKLGIQIVCLGTTIAFSVINLGLVVAGTTYTFCYRTFSS